MTLREARIAFTYALVALVWYATDQGYEMAFAEGMDRKTLKDPTTDHMAGSLHEIGLAQDIDLYKDGTYLTTTDDHKRFGDWWEQYGKDNKLPLVWGGHFHDGNHYSLSFNGKQ